MFKEIAFSFSILTDRSVNHICISFRKCCFTAQINHAGISVMTVAVVGGRVPVVVAVTALRLGRVSVGRTSRVVMGVLLVLGVHCVPLGVDGLLPDLIAGRESSRGAISNSNDAAS